MYERFTDRSRKVMQLAKQEAQQFQHEYIGTEHILLGLVSEGSGVAANVLKNLNINPKTVRREIEIIVQHGESDVERLTGRLPQTPRAKKVIDYAIEEARQLNHNYVGTEHILLGLLREEEGVAAQVLLYLGLKLEDVRDEVLRLLGANLPANDPAEIAPFLVGVERPEALTETQLQIVRDWIREFEERKEQLAAQQNFEAAAVCREQVQALKRLLAWYDWFRDTES